MFNIKNKVLHSIFVIFKILVLQNSSGKKITFIRLFFKVKEKKKMAKLNWIPFIVFLLVAIECGVAQFIFDDQERFIEPTKYVDQKVKNLLLSKFASIDYELGRTLNDMKKQITSDLESKLLLNVNNRISKMEDEIRILKEKGSLKENNEQELITNITDTLDSKINFSFKEMGLSINVSYNSLDEKLSKLTKNLKSN